MERLLKRPESPQPPTKSNGSAAEHPEPTTKPDLPPSPTRSDKSSESEGRPVREKLQETRIDAQTTSDAIPTSDLPMDDAPNGTTAPIAQAGDQSPSGSESERGRLRRKRSREDFEDDQEIEKHPKKKEHHTERHARKKSRDVTSPKDSDVDILTKAPKTSVAPIHENDGDEVMATADVPAHAQSSTVKSKDTATAIEAKEIPNTEQTLNKSNTQPPAGVFQSKAKIPSTSGFANTSVASPFAALSPPPQTMKATGASKDNLPQTSSDKFKSSGFSTFSNSSASPFGGLGNSSSSSPFAAATSGPKVTSFASSTSTSNTTGGGFAALGGASGNSAFGGTSAAPIGGKSVFGGGLGNSSFGGFGGSKIGLPSFATPGQTSITGLSQKPAQTFGTQQKDADTDDEAEAGEDDEPSNDGTEDQERSSKLKPIEVETGEEGEVTQWTGRAKLYTMVTEGKDKRWQERGIGAFKFNLTDDKPKKARFVLRADGTHRLILNAAVPKNMKFGDAQGKHPGDSGRLFFNSPIADGKVEMYLIKIKAERAVELYQEVKDIQDTML
ncbi:hypothetical protein K504DRAFT_450807 [Pleomassaria siparia CBS 279.74]|uniref:RanBD1 domain-containing protein n=1 Tax=Pleomassaria siparia CBS 279.74 TaxID=1314801 RepID=A0A6G1KNW7_9PLEO|nr:hypothetical protein K504DRAFT_450807 [Pleomassaria siparia CBS 279.74]